LSIPKPIFFHTVRAAELRCIWGGQIVEMGHSQISVIFNIWYPKLCHIYGD
jgi:hypothetical protein